MTNETGEAIDARARVIARARSYLGPNGAPCDRDPVEFFDIFAPMYGAKEIHTKAWCGIFAGSVLVLEGLWPASATRWHDGTGFVTKAVADGHLRVVKVPEPGDLVVFGAPLWHHAIVESVDSGFVHTIDGNSIGNLGMCRKPGCYCKGSQPREGVRTEKHPLDINATCYSIHPLISDPGQ